MVESLLFYMNTLLELRICGIHLVEAASYLEDIINTHNRGLRTPHGNDVHPIEDSGWHIS